ncbi:MAG TPA: Minf_1886 family protein [Thermoguttaceae bacterium]|nr:Minf_1886 family protein [Thermoguttaceae bacterium]
MLDPSHPIAELLKKDRRYAFEAYVFVFEALSYAQNVMRMGTETTVSRSELDDSSDEFDPDRPSEEEISERHVSGQELCQAIRQFAVEQFGYMAHTVLSNWGIHETGDFGEIVFNLISIGQMRKTPNDRREDFDDVYDFDTAFRQEFRITPPE